MKSVLILICSMISSCCKIDEANVDVPGCIVELAIYYAHHADCNYATIREYDFQNQHVFIFDLDSCIPDVGVDVLNSNCEFLGSMGGLGSKYILNGVDFNAQAVFIRTIWEK